MLPSPKAFKVAPVSIETPYELVGGRERVLALAERFYDVMERDEAELTAAHELDDSGKVSRRSRDRFGLFLVGWLGGPQEYMEQHGHPRLRMRHRGVSIDTPFAEAWLRCMTAAMNEEQIEGRVREFLDARFAEVAMFLRNRPDS